ncbi:MAG: hypothetical protein JSV31_26540 [Desulfobacterales bacterium]|nr:MAG: hypothetical protein JSV31_26540 [Desulfobacterales bacterium]
MDRPRCLNLRFVLVFCLLAALFYGCAMLPVPTRSNRVGETGPLGNCADFFASLDKKTGEAAVLDPGVFRVKNYPYLRVNRFIASFGEQVNQRDSFVAWTEQMQALDKDARKYEIANLPDSAVAMLDAANGRAGLYNKVAACGDLLKEADFRDIEHQQELRKRVSAPDEYIVLRRVLGIYPLTSLFISHGVSKWHEAAHKKFSNEPPVNWQTIRYVPDQTSDWKSVRQIFAAAKRDALGIPYYSPEQREALFRMYAPLWEIQIQSDDDRIGTPIWTGKGVLDVDTHKPQAYALLSFTRFGKQILTQLNYIIWFPSRPKQSDWDLYGGLLDGLNYRVTLDSDGAPLLYETVHNCGCYYKAYPTERLQVRAKIDYAEPPLIFKAPDLDRSIDLMTVAMESRTHYVQHLYPLSREMQPEAVAYSLAEYGQLRSLPYSGMDRRSMFDQYSLAPGSDRLERFILWPTGVLSPGGMRQWGRHAVAFVGRRHFDDPFYMDRMFEEPGSK